MNLIKDQLYFILSSSSPPVLSGARTPVRWSSSSSPSESTSSSTSSTPWRLTWQRKASCRLWRRPPPRAALTGSRSEGRPERGGRHPGAPCRFGAFGDLQHFEWARTHPRKTKRASKNYSFWVIPFDFGFESGAFFVSTVCESCFWHRV